MGGRRYGHRSRYRSADNQSVSVDGPIFIVHGSDVLSAERVARVIERGTGRDATILHEADIAGQTILEKFERHAEQAAFAVVILTPDDEGRRIVDESGRRGSENALPFKARGRQNVIFELGFFFGRLGRKRVLVLRSPDVEEPSDINGLVYEPFDANGAWKQRLAKELRAAGIEVNAARIP